MLRTFFLRVCSLFAVLLLLQSSSADALGLHRCAHHDALPAGEAGHTHDHGDEPAPDETGSGCTCVGTCSISTAAAVAGARSSVAGVAPLTALLPVPLAQAILPAAVPFFLPYSTAPPAAL